MEKDLSLSHATNRRDNAMLAARRTRVTVEVCRDINNSNCKKEYEAYDCNPWTSRSIWMPEKWETPEFKSG